MSCLILGALGFCGRHLVGRLRQTGVSRLVGADVLDVPPDGCVLDEYHRVDIRDFDQVRDVIGDAQPDCIFNLAASASGPARTIFAVNLMGPIHLLEAVRLDKPDARVLLVGSAAEYGIVSDSMLPVREDHPCRPVGDYGVSKYSMTLAALSYARFHDLRVVVMRPFNIVGPGIPDTLVVGAVIRRVLDALSRPGDPIVKVGNLDTQRDFVAVEDVVESYVRAIQADCWGEVFNVCSGTPRTIRSVVEMIVSRSPRPVKIEVSADLMRSSDIPVLYGSREKAHRCLGFEPRTPLEESLKAAWDFLGRETDFS